MNLNIVANSRFKARSFDDLLKPLAMYTQEYNAIELGVNELDTKASIWENMANELTDPYAYKMYKKYSDDLKNAADSLATSGLSNQSRSNLMKLKARYSLEITPIELAYAARKELAKELLLAMLQDPTLLLSRRAATTSLDDYIRNPLLAYESYSGKLLTAQAATAALALAKQMRDNPRKWRNILHGAYYETLMQKGFTSQDVLEAIQRSPLAKQELLKIMDDVVGSSKIASWNDREALLRAYEYAGQGLWSGVGETLYQMVQNPDHLNPLLRALLRQINQQLQNISKLAINPLNIYSARELNNFEKIYKLNIKNFSKYFYKDKDGKVKMTWAGWKEYNKKIKIPTKGDITVTPEGTTILTNVEGTKYRDSSFKTFMDSIGAKGMSWLPGNLGNLWGKYLSTDKGKSFKYDATKVTEYDMPVDSSQLTNIKNAILTAARGRDLEEVEYDDKSKSFKSTNSKISMSDLNSNDYLVLSTRFSIYGSTAMIKDNEGNVRRFKLPVGINTTNELNRDRALIAANNWLLVINTGMYRDEKGNSYKATPLELKYAQDLYELAILQAHLFHSLLGILNKTKTQEYNPYGY